MVQALFRRARSVLLICALLTGLVLAGCGGDSVGQVTVGTLSIDTAAPVLPSAVVQASIPVSAPESVAVTYEWTVSDGVIKAGQGTSAIVYQAPAEPGTYGINVKVTARDTVHLRDVSVIVEGATGVAVQPVPATPSPGGRCTIDAPADDALVQCEVSASGTYADGIEEPIWLLVVSDGLFFPQDAGGEAFGKIGGRWLGTVRFGVCTSPQKDVGKTFGLVAVVAGEKCNQAFEDWIAEGRRTGSYPGLSDDDLPGDCSVCASILVTRE